MRKSSGCNRSGTEASHAGLRGLDMKAVDFSAGWRRFFSTAVRQVYDCGGLSCTQLFLKQVGLETSRFPTAIEWAHCKIRSVIAKPTTLLTEGKRTDGAKMARDWHDALPLSIGIFDWCPVLWQTLHAIHCKTASEIADGFLWEITGHDNSIV